MSSLGSEASEVNSTSVEAAIAWMEQKSAGGELNPETGKKQIQALKSLIATMREDEDRSAQNVLDGLPDYARRWTNLNQGNKSETARTYQTRSRSLLEAYIAWLEDPVAFRFPEARQRAKAVDAGKNKKEKEKVEASAPRPEPANETHVPPQSNAKIVVKLPLADGGEAVVTFDRSLKISDVKRIAWVLLGHAADFDPSSSPNEVFSIVRAG